MSGRRLAIRVNVLYTPNCIRNSSWIWHTVDFLSWFRQVSIQSLLALCSTLGFAFNVLELVDFVSHFTFSGVDSDQITSTCPLATTHIFWA